MVMLQVVDWVESPRTGTACCGNDTGRRRLTPLLLATTIDRDHEMGYGLIYHGPEGSQEQVRSSIILPPDVYWD